MKKYIIYSILGVALCGLITGCLPEKAETGLTYKGPTVVEVKNQTLGQITAQLNARGIYTTTAQSDSSRTVLINSRPTDSILVQLVGPQSSSAIDINYTVRSTVPASAPVGTTLAVEGTNYNFRTVGARKVTFAPNTSQAYILVDIIPNSIPTVGQQRILSIDITGNAQIAPSVNYSKFLLMLRR